MFATTVKGFQRFPQVGAQIDALCLAALQDAVEVASSVANAGSTTIRLDLETLEPRPVVDGFFGGVRSRKRGKRGARLAPIFDEGTLGQHRGKLSHNRRSSWNVTRKGTTYRAQRHQITPGEGIPAERFFPRARAAGRKALLARFARGIV